MGAPVGPSPTQKTWGTEVIRTVDIQKYDDYNYSLFYENVSVSGNKTYINGIKTDKITIDDTGEIFCNISPMLSLVINSFTSFSTKFMTNGVIADSSLSVTTLNDLNPIGHKSRHSFEATSESVKRRGSVFVGPNGDYTTITAAINHIQTVYPYTGDVIVMSGTYTENITLASNMNLIGVGYPTIVGTVTNGINSIIKSFKINGKVVMYGIKGQIYDSIITATGENAINIFRKYCCVIGCKISCSNGYGIQIWDNTINDYRNFSYISRNVISCGANTGGIVVYNGMVRIEGNLILGSSLTGIGIFCSTVSGGIEYSGIIINNNKIKQFNYGVQVSLICRNACVHGNYARGCSSGFSILSTGCINSDNLTL